MWSKDPTFEDVVAARDIKMPVSSYPNEQLEDTIQGLRQRVEEAELLRSRLLDSLQHLNNLRAHQQTGSPNSRAPSLPI